MKPRHPLTPNPILSRLLTSASKKALSVLKDYYAKGDKSHSAAEGAGSGIISLLEVCESDFTKGLTEMTAEDVKCIFPAGDLFW